MAHQRVYKLLIANNYVQFSHLTDGKTKAQMRHNLPSVIYLGQTKTLAESKRCQLCLLRLPKVPHHRYHSVLSFPLHLVYTRDIRHKHRPSVHQVSNLMVDKETMFQVSLYKEPMRIQCIMPIKETTIKYKVKKSKKPISSLFKSLCDTHINNWVYFFFYFLKYVFSF